MTATAGERALAWHVPPHLAMLGAMAVAMATDATGHLIAALALGALTLGLTPFARAHRVVHCVLLDLGAMSLALASAAMATPSGGAGHAHTGSGIPLALVALVWLVSRARLTHGRVALATGVLCAVQLAAMLVL
jgi:hypothetical protein